MESSRENDNFVKSYSDNLFAVPQPSNKPESTEFKHRVLPLLKNNMKLLSVHSY